MWKRVQRWCGAGSHSIHCGLGDETSRLNPICFMAEIPVLPFFDLTSDKHQGLRLASVGSGRLAALVCSVIAVGRL